MPNYNASLPANSLGPGFPQLLLWNAETVAAGTASQRCNLQASPRRPLTGFSLELQFAGDPGVFEFDLQEADTDRDGNYQLYQSISTTSGTPNWVARLDVPLPALAFLRGYMKTLTNAVAVTAKLTGY